MARRIQGVHVSDADQIQGGGHRTSGEGTVPMLSSRHSTSILWSHKSVRGD